ncbi:putative L-ascorbate peroxidase [Helianthus anomalus]
MTFMITFLLPLPKSIQSSGADAYAAADDLVLVQEEIRKVLSKSKAAGVLRLVFHDAGTYEMDDDSGGMNGSISFELDRPENKGLKKPLKILVEAKTIVDEKQPVSMADMIVVAGAEAVSLCGGPKIPGKLPEETLDASGLKESFQRKGFSTQELVALSGAHTLGSKGFGNPVIFDNAYYKVLLEKPWLSSAGMTSMVGLPSDRALVDDDECLRWISKYADDQDLFFEDFKNAYIKLVNSGAKWRRDS